MSSHQSAILKARKILNSY